jgi:hypothetical protein
MDKELLAKVGIELAMTLFRSAVSLAKTLGVEAAELDAAFEKERQQFLLHDPKNLPPLQ